MSAKDRVLEVYPNATCEQNYLEGGVYIDATHTGFLGEAHGNGSLRADEEAAWENAWTKMLGSALASG